MKFLPILIAAKLAVAAGAGAYLYTQTDTFKELSGDGAKELSAKELGSNAESGNDEKGYGAGDIGPESNESRFISLDNVPDIPEGKAGLTDYTRIRSQLELMKQEVEEKIVRLKLATDAYVAAKTESEEKLSIIAQEKQLLDETLQKEKKVQKDRIKEALAFVEKMEPKKAAPVFEQMDRDLSIQLFKQLKPKKVTKLLEAMNPAKATEYMEYYTKIRSGREYELLKDLKMCEGADFAEDKEEIDQ